MEELLVAIGNFGFPIVTTIYLLIRMEGKMDKLTDSIRSLSQALESSIRD